MKHDPRVPHDITHDLSLAASSSFVVRRFLLREKANKKVNHSFAF